MKHHGSMHRTRKQAHDYTKHRQGTPDGCQFCAFTRDTEQVIDELPQFWIVRNIFPYAIWDDYHVNEHLMIVPKRHVVSLAEFTDEEKLGYVNLIAEYEHRGYSVYSRTDNGPTKSIPHQHTHLIRVSDRPVDALYYSSSPHLLLYR